MTRIALFLFLIISAIAPSSQMQQTSTDKLMLKMKIIGVKDGDTVEALYYKLPVVIRLEHIDAPEKKQAFGAVSKKKLSDLVFGKVVTIVSSGKKGKYDRYGRMIAEIYINEKSCANKEMVRAGLAWHFIRFSGNREYAQLEENARKSKVGLWSDPHAIAPWNFRR